MKIAVFCLSKAYEYGDVWFLKVLPDILQCTICVLARNAHQIYEQWFLPAGIEEDDDLKTLSESDIRFLWFDGHAHFDGIDRDWAYAILKGGAEPVANLVEN